MATAFSPIALVWRPIALLLTPLALLSAPVATAPVALAWLLAPMAVALLAGAAAPRPTSTDCALAGSGVANPAPPSARAMAAASARLWRRSMNAAEATAPGLSPLANSEATAHTPSDLFQTLR